MTDAVWYYRLQSDDVCHPPPTQRLRLRLWRHSTTCPRSGATNRRDPPDSRPTGIAAQSCPAAVAPVAVVAQWSHYLEMRWPEPPYTVNIWRGSLLASEEFSGTPAETVAYGGALLDAYLGRTLVIRDVGGDELYRLHRADR